VNLEIEPPLTNLMTPEGSPVVGRIAKAPIKVPATVKRMYDDAVALPSQDKLAAFDYLNRKATTVALISPVEMATHTYNVINALTTMPGGLGSKALAVLGPPGKWAEAIAKVGNVNDAGYVKDLMTLTEYGGSRRGLMVANQTGKVLEGVRAPVFGTRGVENLSRVTALRGLREFAPELNETATGLSVTGPCPAAPPEAAIAAPPLARVMPLTTAPAATMKTRAVTRRATLSGPA
jgi:hypothetical protein